jgi:hypothetical protein
MAAKSPRRAVSAEQIRSLVSTAFAADPRDRVIGPVGEHRYSTIFGIIPDVLAVLRSAAGIEQDSARLYAWYMAAPIAELGDLTAHQLVAMGRADVVLAFLGEIRTGVRR